jgi:hypothetical protein
MDFAAKAMALTGFELLTNQDALSAAKDEFQQSTGGRKYVTPLPEDAVPH